MIQQYKIVDHLPETFKFSFTSAPTDCTSPLFILSNGFLQTLSNQQCEMPHMETLVRYLNKSSQMVNDLNANGNVTLYTFDPQDNFSKADLHVLKDNARKSGCQVARMMKGKLGTVFFSPDISFEQINEFLFALQLASYRWDMKTKKVVNEPQNILNNKLELVQQNLNGFQEFVQNDWKQKMIYNLPTYILRLRYIVQQRPNIATTSYMIEYIEEMHSKFKQKVSITKIVGDQLLEQNLNLIHAVGRTGKQPPALVILKHNGNKQNPDEPYLALIGKGVIFDCGGLSIKSSAGMETMYDDKTGACTVLEAFNAIVSLDIPINVVCTVALVENSIGCDAYRVSDVITSYKGLTVEILNTDAEGRLILADAMSYTQKNYPISCMIELSTLTGAVKAAIGETYAGLFTNRLKLVEKMKDISLLSEEQFWHLPINDEHRNAIKGAIADINNSGGKTGASCAAAFLENFVENKVKWMHWDIAAVALKASDSYIYNKGASGFGLQQLVYFAAAKAKLPGLEFKKKANKKNKKQKEQQVQQA